MAGYGYVLGVGTALRGFFDVIAATVRKEEKLELQRVEGERLQHEQQKKCELEEIELALRARSQAAELTVRREKQQQEHQEKQQQQETRRMEIAAEVEEKKTQATREKQLRVAVFVGSFVVVGVVAVVVCYLGWVAAQVEEKRIQATREKQQQDAELKKLEVEVEEKRIQATREKQQQDAELKKQEAEVEEKKYKQPEKNIRRMLG